MEIVNHCIKLSQLAATGIQMTGDFFFKIFLIAINEEIIYKLFPFAVEQGRVKIQDANSIFPSDICMPDSAIYQI